MGEVIVKNCLLTNIEVNNHEAKWYYGSGQSLYYNLFYKEKEYSIGICRGLYKIITVKEDDYGYNQCREDQEEFKKYLPFFLRELSHNNFKELFGKVIHWNCDDENMDTEDINIKSFVDKIYPQGVPPVTHSEKSNELLQEIYNEQERDFSEISIANDFKLRAKSYMRDSKELKSYLEDLQDQNLIKIGNEYIKFTGEGLDYIEKLNNTDNQFQLPMNQNREFSLDIFISHSSSDKIVAQKLIQLLRSAMNIESSRIRCTSVEGYKLEGGVNTDEQLRKEVEDNKLFIGIISKESIQSHYVLYELGARWGLKLPFKPVVCSSDDYSLLKAPLKNYHVMNLSNPADVMQLMDETAQILEKDLEKPHVYNGLINEMKKTLDSMPREKEGKADPTYIYWDEELKKSQK